MRGAGLRPPELLTGLEEPRQVQEGGGLLRHPHARCCLWKGWIHVKSYRWKEHHMIIICTGAICLHLILDEVLHHCFCCFTVYSHLILSRGASDSTASLGLSCQTTSDHCADKCSSHLSYLTSSAQLTTLSFLKHCLYVASMTTHFSFSCFPPSHPLRWQLLLYLVSKCRCV